MKYFLNIIAIIICISCSNQGKEEFEKAKQINTIESYAAFLKNFNTGAYADSARYSIEKLEFSGLNFINKTEVYENFIIKYPSSKFLDSAKSKIYSLEFDIMEKDNSISSVEEYLKKYPNSPFIEECNERIKQLKYLTSDEGIKSNVLSLIGSNCTKRRAKISVKDGRVKLSMNCIDVSRNCISKGNSISAVLSGRRKCRSVLNNLEKKVKKIPGVKFVEIFDTSD